MNNSVTISLKILVNLGFIAVTAAIIFMLNHFNLHDYDFTAGILTGYFLLKIQDALDDFCENYGKLENKLLHKRRELNE